MNKARLIAAALLVSGALGAAAACTSTNASIPGDVPAAATHAAPAPTQSGPDGSALHPLPFGATSLGGIDMTVSAPTTYHPSDSAYEEPKMPRAIVMTVTVVNHTENAVAIMDLLDSATANDTSASQITDTGVGDDVTASALPGHTLKYKIAYGIPSNTTDLSVTIQTALTSTYWQGSVK